jgi:SAM-dependent methyltransferase
MNFGDGISWDKHVDEIVERKEVIWYDGTSKNHFEDALDYVKTGTPREEWKALDCGCHIGRFIDIVEKYGLDYTGVDQSQKALDFAKNQYPDRKWVLSYLWEMPFKEEFDLVFTNAVLQHNKLSEQLKIVPRMYTALKPGGVFFMSESTEPVQTETQRTYRGWIDMVESFGLTFVKSWHKNPCGFDDKYMFIKERV